MGRGEEGSYPRGDAAQVGLGGGTGARGEPGAAAALALLPQGLFLDVRAVFFDLTWGEGEGAAGGRREK